MGQLDGKVAIVTGSGRDIGREVALRRPRRRLQRRRIQKMSDEQGLLASVTIRKTGNAAAIFSNCASGASLFTGTCGRAPGARRR